MSDDAHDASRSEAIRFFDEIRAQLRGRFGGRIVWERVCDKESPIHAVYPPAPWIFHPFRTSYDSTRESSNCLQVK